ncbi:N-acetylmuramoyl-L-alanine amidase [Streptomyces specialis]|uniref:N-acetylmuramoyl-L-alanine amidase n=1 Tax=Streptomyces specialis TaxID=498367 RepID=UPI00073EDD7E|nr:peptidoglycan recognition family protein [Streptomyces specialis]
MAPPPPPGPRPSRRSLLRGGAVLATGTTALSVSGDQALGRTATAALPTGEAGAAEFPGAAWAPAAASTYTAADRPSTYPVRYVVIHVAQETYADTVGIFQDPAREVSAHYVVAADGRIAQCVRERDIGWHAGNWSYNTLSIGIEHEGWVDEPRWFTTTMYERSAALTARICAAYGIPRTRARVIGHHEVPDATHTDPGPHWDWDRYLTLVNAL